MTRLKPLIAAALALGSSAVVPAAQAQRWQGGDGEERAYRGDPYRGEAYRAPDRDRAYRDEAYRGGWARQPGADRDGYAQHAYYQPAYPQRASYQGYDRGGGWDAPGYRRCNSGTTGTIVGALAGGLLGRTIDGRGDRALGTILGAGAGALAGRAVEKSGNAGYCR